MEQEHREIPKVSIVVPVYNKGKYLEETLNSIVNQTMQDIEIICVNDASTDDSLHVLEKFAQEDSRISIINNSSNQGAAVSRNKGFEKSNGQYICFLDADDIYSENMIQKEYTAICKYNAEFAVVHMVAFTGDIQDACFQRSAAEFQWEEQCVSMENAEQNLLRVWGIGPVNKMYDKEFIETYHLSYQNLSSSNDVFLGSMAVLLAKKIVLVESKEPMIYRRKGTGTQISDRRISMNTYLAFEKIHDSMVKWEIWEKYFDAFFDFFYGVMFAEYRHCEDEEVNRKTYSYIAKEGLRKLGFLDIPEEKFKDRNLYHGLKRCMQYSYDSAWFREYEKLLVWNTDKIISKLELYHADHKNIAVWGAAARAESFIKFSQNNNYSIEFVVDRDTSKQGKEICGMEIKKFADISDAVDVVIVLRSSYYEEIESTVKRIDQRIEVFDLEKYLLY